MLVTSLHAFVLTAAMVLVATGVAAAGGALKSVLDDWQVRCDTPSGAQGEQCALTQSVIAEDKTDVWLHCS
jgi:invasion protein IalB